MKRGASCAEAEHEMTTIMDDIHGHEVMRMMVDSGKAYTRESLRADIIERFGADARFCTCSAANMTSDQLIDFLAERGKFVEAPQGFTTHPEKICNH